MFPVKKENALHLFLNSIQMLVGVYGPLKWQYNKKKRGISVKCGSLISTGLFYIPFNKSISL